MKKTTLYSAIAITALGSGSANAFHDLEPTDRIIVTNMLFGTTNYASSGSLLRGGGGAIQSVDPFFYHTWTGAQATAFLDTSGSFAGSNVQGTWDYSAEIAGMTDSQLAVGLFFNWNGHNDIALLEIFDCPSYEICTGAASGSGVAMGNGPFITSVATFSGYYSTAIVPVPAAVWLMGTGLLGLVSIGRRKRILG